jgi:DNA processing protein
MSPAEALRLPAAELTGQFGVSSRAACAFRALDAPLLRGRAVLNSLGRLGAGAVFYNSPQYPPLLTQYLGTSAPLVLFVVGDAGILLREAAAVVGSREPSKSAAGAARRFAADNAAAGLVVVSGGAVGIDTAAHQGAVSKGETCVVPPVGIARFRWRGMSSESLLEDRWCVLGQFPPLSGWMRRNALIRNRTIVALSKAVVAFEPRDCGGTWRSCICALEMKKPLFVASALKSAAHRRGMQRLVNFGAAPLELSSMPDPATFRKMVEEYRPPPGASQLPLFHTPEALD